MGLIGKIFDAIFHDDNDDNINVDLDKEYLEDIEKAIEEGDINEALSTIDLLDSHQCQAYFKVGYYFEEKNDIDNALLFYKKAISSFEDETYHGVWDKRVATYCYYFMAGIYKDEKDDIEKARACMMSAYLYCDSDWMEEGDEDEMINMEKAYFNEWDRLDDEYTENFLDIPYKDRKYLLVADTVRDLNQNSFSTLFRGADLSHLSFPLGHPQANELYVAHPLATNRYIPIEDYQLEMIEDKVRELCELAQALGAKQIDIDCLNSNSSYRTDGGEKNVSGGGSRKGVGANASYHNESSNHLLERLSRSISLHQEFQPRKVPFVPDNLIWYKGEPNWQRLCRQRLEGGLLTHEERIATSECKAGSSHEMNSVKAELKVLFTEIDVKFDKTYKTKFEQMEDAVLAIKIKFAPLSELTGSSTKLVSKNAGASVNEQKYIDEVRKRLVDGKIRGTGRKLINKMREQLGISEARAAELEASVTTPQLTDDEKEYLEAYREASANGEISDAERRDLDNLRNMLGISKKRAKEIEKI